MPNTSRGYPYPTIADSASGPTQIQSLAQAVDNDLSSNFVPATYIRMARSVAFPITANDTWYGVNAWLDGTQKRVGNITYAGSGLVQINVAGEYAWEFSAAWPGVDSSNAGFRRYGTVLLGRGGATPTELTSNGVPVGAGKHVDIIPPGAWGGVDTTFAGTIPCQVGDVLMAAVRQSQPPTVAPTPYVFIVRRVA